MRAVRVGVAVSLVLSSLTLVPGPAAAGEPRTHDDLYVRWTLGLGHAGTGTEFRPAPALPSATIDYSGLAFEGDLAIGVALRKNLAAHLTFWGSRVNDPKIDDPENYDSPPGTSEVSGELFSVAAGPGVTWFLPAGTYVSGSAGVATLRLSRKGDDTKYSTDSGFSFSGVLGKDWWVSPWAALGVAGGVQYHSAKDRPKDGLFDQKSTWSGFSYSLRFSATFD